MIERERVVGWVTNGRREEGTDVDYCQEEDGGGRLSRGPLPKLRLCVYIYMSSTWFSILMTTCKLWTFEYEDLFVSQPSVMLKRVL